MKTSLSRTQLFKSLLPSRRSLLDWSCCEDSSKSTKRPPWEIAAPSQRLARRLPDCYPAFRLVHSTRSAWYANPRTTRVTRLTDGHPSYRQHGCDVILPSKQAVQTLEILDELSEKLKQKWGPGFTIHSPRKEANEGEIDHTIEAILAKVPSKKVWSTWLWFENTWYSRNKEKAWLGPL